MGRLGKFFPFRHRSFCLTILKHHFPNATTYSDIRGTDFTPWRNRIDVLSGGFPCPPFSQAGKRQGTADDRYLWPEMYRTVCEIRPRWVVAENVLGIVNWNAGVVFEQVHLDLETAGYSVQTFVLPACGVNAPHQRYRTWFIAHRDDDQLRARDSFEEQRWTATVTDGSSGHAGYAWDTNGIGFQSRPTPDSDYYGYEVRSKSSGQDESSQDRNDVFIGASGYGLQRAAANADSVRPENLPTASDGQDSHPIQRGNIHSRALDDGTEWIVTHTECCRSNEICQDLQSEQPNGERSYGNGSERNTSATERAIGHDSFGGSFSWQDFPTQSSVCRGDDGISEILHGITFPRWRRESIKAYGNAIVPQVVYRIFRVIEYMSNGK